MLSTPEDLHDALHANFLFQQLTNDEIKSLAKSVEVRDYEGGTVIVREGEDADTLYLVVAGNVNVMKGNDQFLAMLGRNGFFGEMGLFAEGAKRSANCVAATPTTCALIDKIHLYGFCEQQPDIGVKIYQAIIKTLAERLQSTSADLAMLMSAQVRTQNHVEDMVTRQKVKTGRIPKLEG